MLTLGSGGQWVVPVSSPDQEPVASTNLYRAVGDGCYRLAPVQNVGITLDWVRNLLGATWEELYAAAARPRRPGTPRFDPHLTPERWNPGATGAWSGLTLACEREDLLRSALDGVAGLLRQSLDDLRAAGHAPQRAVIGGGGDSDPAWRALLEEALALPLTPASASWLTPAGAARLAAEAAAALPADPPVLAQSCPGPVLPGPLPFCSSNSISPYPSSSSSSSLLLVVAEQVAEEPARVAEEPPGLHDLQLLPAGPPGCPSRRVPGCARRAPRRRGGVGRDHQLRPGGGQVVQRATRLRQETNDRGASGSSIR